MEIVINSKAHTVDPGATVLDALRELGYVRQVAVVVNGRRLLQAEYATHRLQDGDQLKVIRPLVGG